MLVAAIAVSVVVYFITHGAQEDEFETMYAGAAEKIMEAFRGIMNQRFGAISSLGVATIAHGVDHFRPWPLTTLSSFQQRSSTAKDLSKALFLSLNPYVKEIDRSKWEEYVVSEDSYWIEQGLEYQKELGLDSFETTLETRVRLKELEANSSSIFTVGGNGTIIPDPGPGPYLVSCVFRSHSVLYSPSNQDDSSSLHSYPYFSPSGKPLLYS